MLCSDGDDGEEPEDDDDEEGDEIMRTEVWSSTRMC